MKKPEPIFHPTRPIGFTPYREVMRWRKRAFWMAAFNLLLIGMLIWCAGR